ncbi:HAUS1 protein, partial [Polypterus senegalus]
MWVKSAFFKKPASQPPRQEPHPPTEAKNTRWNSWFESAGYLAEHIHLYKKISAQEHVSKWLSSLFGNKPVPVYEVNTRTTDILYELAECSESRCEDISLLIEDLKQKSTEYNVEGSYNHELLLEAVGLSSNILSKTALSCLNALEGTTVALSAKDTSLCSLMAAMDDLTNEVCATERKNQELDQQLTLLKKQMTAALVLHRSLQEDLGKTEDAQAVEMAKAENRLQNMDFLKAKSTDLIHRIRSCEASIDADLTVKVDMMEMFLPEQHKRSMF